MAKAQSLVRGRRFARFAGRRTLGALAIAAGGLILLAPGCATPVRQAALAPVQPVQPAFLLDEDVMVAHDGARLGLSVWEANVTAPDHVVVGVHGMNDWADAFHMAGPYWAERGVTTYAYDQRGFGRSPGKGIWPEEALMREDLRTVVDLARAAHPDAEITVVGLSMGAAVGISAFGSDRPPAADKFIASGPGLRGWGAMNPAYRMSLWMSARTRPAWIVRPPRRLVRIEPSDNTAMLQRTWANPNMTLENRIDQVDGVVSLMESAHDRAQNLPEGLPVLMTYGANDYVIPADGVKRTAKVLPGHVRTAYYEDGFHMLIRDLQAETVHTDYLAFMRAADEPLPSGAPDWPWAE